MSRLFQRLMAGIFKSYNCPSLPPSESASPLLWHHTARFRPPSAESQASLSRVSAHFPPPAAFSPVLTDRIFPDVCNSISLSAFFPFFNYFTIFLTHFCLIFVYFPILYQIVNRYKKCQRFCNRYCRPDTIHSPNKRQKQKTRH